MAHVSEQAKKNVLRRATLRGKTKRELAEAAGLSYSYGAEVVNRLLFERKLEIIGKLGTGADVFAKAFPSKEEVPFSK